MLDVLARCSQSDESFAGWLNAVVSASPMPWFVRGRALIALSHTDTFPAQEVVGELFEAASFAARPDVIAAVQLAETDWSEEFIGTLTTGDVLLKEVAGLVEAGPLRSVL